MGLQGLAHGENTPMMEWDLGGLECKSASISGIAFHVTRQELELAFGHKAIEYLPVDGACGFISSST